MAPPSSGTYGSIGVEFWDVSGDMKYEKCWDPIIKGADGIMFVLDPAAPQGNDQITNFQRVFMQQSGVTFNQTFLFVNQHNKESSGAMQDSSIPKSFRDVDQVVGTAEDSSFCVQGFERFFSKLLKELNEQKRADEDNALEQ